MVPAVGLGQFSGAARLGQLCLRFGGFYRYAKILEAIAAGIASGEIRVPK